MDQNRSQVLKNLLNGIVFISLFICFLFLYFINETNEFLKGSTTFATRTEEVNKFTVPVLVICFEPNYKPSIFGNGTADFHYLFEKEDLIEEGEKLTDFLKSASYKLNEDVQIGMVMKDGNMSVKYDLEVEHKVMDNFHIDVYQMHTLSQGSCYVIESTEKVSPWVTLEVYVKDLNSENDDILSSINLFVASRETWYGIITSSWPYFELKEFEFSYNIPKMHWMDMQVTNITYQNGHKSIEDCIENLMATNDDCKKCSPFFFSFKNKKISCQLIEDNKCWSDWIFLGKNHNTYKKCMKPRQTTLYNAKSKLYEKVGNQSNIMELQFGYSSDQIKIEEETLMIGTSSYIGSVGGSLGLFMGFSVFTYLSYCIDKFFELWH